MNSKILFNAVSIVVIIVCAILAGTKVVGIGTAFGWVIGWTVTSNILGIIDELKNRRK